MDKLIKFFATGFGTGYMPKAQGTFGTAVGVALFWALSDLPFVHYAIVTIVFIVFASWIAEQARGLFGNDDPPQVTIDEIAGFLVTMLGHAWSWKSIAAGFVLFRIFDILKPFPVRSIDRKIKNGWGIVLDDVLAGAYANACLMILSRLL
ncbi:MAG: phosphatidylglycerophosphatase A [Deltaproteobacteria bacterium]|nr:phosphatidylglycerophosphatase A [Deltaproteobacteria bacterium]MBI2341243.1 phosphatidylglycerophosphatase A [Deltaproteobacteria bacterium]